MVAAPPASGIYPPVPTFFASRKAANYNDYAAPVDVDAQVAHALYLARAGIHGLVVLGSTGEAVHMTRQERTSVLSGVRRGLDREGFKDYPLIAGTASPERRRGGRAAARRPRLGRLPVRPVSGARLLCRRREPGRDSPLVHGRGRPVPHSRHDLPLPGRVQQRQGRRLDVRHAFRPSKHRRLQAVVRRPARPHRDRAEPGREQEQVCRLYGPGVAAVARRGRGRRGRHRRRRRVFPKGRLAPLQAGEPGAAVRRRGRRAQASAVPRRRTLHEADPPGHHRRQGGRRAPAGVRRPGRDPPAAAGRLPRRRRRMGAVEAVGGRAAGY
ncbi:dihydrodipicolinate synthase [Magnaporthiopsis poae ATCC 64411]|uniref:Dihydrodipicolinate synthase n=1 Tax=Magnaporthiopsis poae (strain ATCC 64411 / 73-15) TaxID=644358 RepID=A0A0C4DZQ0_MAGP6|nr:dihydrodipicolinate synthase [Magnaporthiopsis poae ATCC 64411]